MSDRVLVQGKRADRDTEEGSGPPAESEETRKKNAKLKQDLDDLLDEIDDVLVENAEAFVNSYEQKGGQ